MDLVMRARAFATEAHGAINQRRKYSDEPYIVHPEAVAALLTARGHDAGTIAGGWLHDVVEDTGVPLERILAEFGPDVADLVRQVSDPAKKEDGNRRQRAEINRRHLATATPRGKSIKLADFLDNYPSIVRCDPGFARVWMREKREALPLLEGGDPVLFDEASKVMANYFTH